MARANELEECCEFMARLLLAYVFETEKTEFSCVCPGRGGVHVIISDKWRWRESVNVLQWEKHCFGESKGNDDTWLL